MSPVEQDRVLLKHAGVITDEESKAQERRITGRVCTVCHTQNSPTSRYCSRCGLGLNEEAQKEAVVADQAFQDPVIMKRLLQLVMDGGMLGKT
jgi:ribosomal protein L40E